jgi:broad specificity phosphatase PhoE
MAERRTTGSVVPEPAWHALRTLDPNVEDQVVTLAACLAMVEQRFQLLYEDVLPRFQQTADDLGSAADALADAHHALTLLEESLHASSRRMLDVLDRVSRELGE